MKTAEEALIRRAQNHDQGALAEIYDRYVDGIYRYLYARTGHQADAEDLTEQVFLKMVDAIGGFRFRGVALSSWLYRIAHNLLVDRYRKADRAPVALGGQVEDGGFHADPERAFASSEERRELVDAIRQLTPEQQQVITLRFIDGLEVQQIADIMRRRPGAIHAMQHRALLSLHRILRRSEARLEARRA